MFVTILMHEKVTAAAITQNLYYLSYITLSNSVHHLLTHGTQVRLGGTKIKWSGRAHPKGAE